MFANEIYNHLGCPDVFLFCPTEYSASLAVPNINKSEYLATVASCLAPGNIFVTCSFLIFRLINSCFLFTSIIVTVYRF